MEQPLIHSGWREFIGAAARTILGTPATDTVPLGDVRLREHQLDVLGRIESSLQRFGGALLADDVGLGKTFVALALARRISRCTIVATPASLRSMWQRSARRAQVEVTIVSIESLGTGFALPDECELLIVDEAHQLRNPRTNRYSAVASIARKARLLLLSATPVHNRESELRALLALFLGARANDLEASEIAAIVIRRERAQLEEDMYVPPVVYGAIPVLPESDDVLEAILALPPPLPPSDGGDGGALIAFTLVRQWSSSFAALIAALQRRLAHAHAIEASLENGILPTTAQLRWWCASDEAIQLPLFGLFNGDDRSPGAAVKGDPRAMLGVVQLHARAVRELLAVSRERAESLDGARWTSLHEIMRGHPDEKVVAFSQFTHTVHDLFRRSLSAGRSGLLTASSSRIASGRVTRDELITLFAPRSNGARPAPALCRVDLLFSTDLLSEGANLQDASVLVHLDLPWTPVRLSQRVGRVARAGSAARQVTVYTFPAPASAEAVLRMERRLAAKLSVAARSVGVSGTVLPILHVGGGHQLSVPQLDARLRSLIRELHAHASLESPGVRDAGGDDAGGMIAAGLHGDGEMRFLALVERHDSHMLIAGGPHGIHDDSAATVSVLEQVRRAVDGNVVDFRPSQPAVNAVLEVVRRWHSTRVARISAGINTGSCARTRVRILRRIDAISSRAPNHVRPRIHAVAARARRIATLPYGHGTEQVLEELAGAEMPDEAWLRALECFGELQRTAPEEEEGFRVVAILFLGSSWG